MKRAIRQIRIMIIVTTVGLIASDTKGEKESAPAGITSDAFQIMQEIKRGDFEPHVVEENAYSNQEIIGQIVNEQFSIGRNRATKYEALFNSFISSTDDRAVVAVNRFRSEMPVGAFYLNLPMALFEDVSCEKTEHQRLVKLSPFSVRYDCNSGGQQGTVRLYSNAQESKIRHPALEIGFKNNRPNGHLFVFARGDLLLAGKVEDAPRKSPRLQGKITVFHHNSPTITFGLKQDSFDTLIQVYSRETSLVLNKYGWWPRFKKYSVRKWDGFSETVQRFFEDGHGAGGT